MNKIFLKKIELFSLISKSGKSWLIEDKYFKNTIVPPNCYSTLESEKKRFVSIKWDNKNNTWIESNSCFPIKWNLLDLFRYCDDVSFGEINNNIDYGVCEKNSLELLDFNLKNYNVANIFKF